MVNSRNTVPEKINSNFKNKHIISLDQFSSRDISLVLETAKKMKEICAKQETSKILEGRIAALIFYEPSSRTFASFATAVKRLGGQTIEILNPEHFSSVSKGETFEDTIRVFEAYSDVIVLRHPQIGAAQTASNTVISVPVINAGDGAGEHPTQALLDMATIKESHDLDNLTGVIAGDLLNGRTVHSLIKGLSLYKNNTLFLLSPVGLRLSREDLRTYLKNPSMSLRGGTTKQSLSTTGLPRSLQSLAMTKKEHGIKLIEIQDEIDMPKNAHFWYWTRVQKERFADKSQYEKLKNKFKITKELMKNFASPKTIIMHPLPRVGEIELEVDSDPRAVYLTSQIRNGLYVRMALLALVLGKIT